MTIASELVDLENNLANAYNAIITAGGTAPQNRCMANLASAIATIPSGGGGGSGNITTLYDVILLPEDFVSDNTYVDYPYKAEKTISGITSDTIAYVTFSDLTISQYLFAPFCSTSTNTITFYANDIPQSYVSIPLIRLIDEENS